MGIEKITYPVKDDFFKLEVWNNNIKAIAEQFRTDENRLTAVEKKASDNATNIGTLSNLTTTEKGSLVGAINEHNDKLNILNAKNIQCFFQNANTFAVSTSTEDIVNCGGRGGTLTAENHRILILNVHHGSNCHSYLMIAKTAEELSYSALGSGHDEQIIKKHITKTGKTIYVAILRDIWIDNNEFSPYARKMSVTINGVNKNMMNYVEVQSLGWDGSGKLTPCLYDLADFILFSWISDDKIAGFYPSSDQYRSDIGSLSSLTTKDKSSLVGAVNEVGKKASDNTTNIGILSKLTTTEKGSLVGAINEMLLSAKHMGLTGRYLENRQINSNFTFKDLIKQTSVTFFTNWTDNTNFPKAYGSGVLIPCHDGGAKIIFYADVIDNDAYFMKVKLSGDKLLTTTKCLTGGNDIPTRSVDVSSLAKKGSIEYNVVNGICNVMINGFVPYNKSNDDLRIWMDICDLPIDKYGNDYSISSSSVGDSTSSSISCCFRYNHNTHKLQLYKNAGGMFYGTLSYPVAD